MCHFEKRSDIFRYINPKSINGFKSKNALRVRKESVKLLCTACVVLIHLDHIRFDASHLDPIPPFSLTSNSSLLFIDNTGFSIFI